MTGRVLVLSDLWLPFPGGAERLVFNIARHLYRAGLTVRALTGYEHARQFDGPPVHAFAIGDGEGDPGWSVVADALGSFDPDVVVTHHHYAFIFEQELAALGLPIVQVVLNGRRLPDAALAVYISEWVASQTGDRRPGDMTITPPAFADVVAESHGDAIGFVKPYPHKGVDLVYAIAEELADRQFVILRGEWPDLEAVRLDLSNVEHLAPVDDVRDFYARCRLVLMPSRSEDAGTVAQEATVNGLPCISSDVGGLVETNAGGIRLDPYDLGRWIDTIRKLDHPQIYESTVERQQRALAKYDHAARFDELAARIVRLSCAGD